MAVPFANLIKAQIIILYVDQDKGKLSKFFSSDSNDKFEDEVKKQLMTLAEEASKKHNLKVGYHFMRGSSVHGKIVEYAEEIRSEMIVMGKGSLVTDYKDPFPILGSNTSRVIRYATCPVITTGFPPRNHDCKQIMLPLDLTKETRQKVTWAIKLAHLFHSEIKVVSALWATNDDTIEKQLVMQLRQVEAFINKSGIKCTAQIVKETQDAKSLVPILLKFVEAEGDIDLIMIMTQQEMNFSEYFVGSHASELIRKAQVPVMSVIPRDMGEIVLGM
jgi:nucleotide-binding universal stress UspA family protein